MSQSEGDGAPAASEVSQDGVLGTLDVVMDGEERTWYVVRGNARSGPYASAVWQEWAEGGTLVSVSGLDTATPPIADFEADLETGVTRLGDYSGSSFSVTVPITGDAGARRFRFPAGDNSGASILYVPDAGSIVSGMDMTNVFSLVEGVIEVVTSDVIDGKAAVRGTFSGTLESIEGGRRIELTDGNFEARNIPPVDSLGDA